MKPAKKVFLSSTCLDLIDLRAELRLSLTNMGYTVYASEFTDFPVDSAASAHDNCLDAVHQCDIYLLIIHTRYGAPYRGTRAINLPEEFNAAAPSITVAEYLTALAADLEIRIWVRDFIWSAATVLDANRSDLDGVNLPPEMHPGVLTFIDYIKNHPHEGGSWINQFHDVVDLKSSIVHWLRQASHENVVEYRRAVDEICDLLGYEFDHALMLSGHESVLARLRNSPFDEQDAIWPVYRESGGSASWQDLRSIINQAADDLMRGICDRALIVINLPFEFSVESELKRHPLARRIRVITYEDLLSALIPFGNYLQRIVYDFEHFKEFSSANVSRDPVIDIMRRCDLFKYYVPLRGKCSPSDLYEYVEEWLISPDANQLTLLGDFGTGKSSFALYLTYRLAKIIVAGHTPNGRIPVFVSLRDHVGKIDVREIIINTLVNTYGIRNASFSSFIKLLDSGRLLIIFDGFDETATRADTGQSLTILRELNSLVRRNAKIILSCRTHFFRTDTEAHTQLARGVRLKETELFTEQKGRTNFQVIYLKEFDPVQIEDFLIRHFDGDTGRTKRTLTTMHSTYNLWDLARRPVLLEMILKVFPRLSRKLGRAVITPAELYEEYIEEWIANVAKGNDDLLDPVAKRNFCHSLSQWMYRSNRELLPYSELANLVQDYFTGRPLAAYAALDTEVRTCSFLNRDALGNYQFVHRSFMEFFVAKAIAGELVGREYDLLAIRLLSFEVRNFLRGLQPDPKLYFDAIDTTKERRGQEDWAGANCIVMLMLLGCDLRGLDFSQASLSGADFTGADLSRCKFRRVNLRRAVLTNARLTDADLSYADLTNIEIREFRKITCICWFSDRLIIGSGDGFVRIYSSVTWELETVLHGHGTGIHSIVPSGGEQFLFTTSNDRLVAWSTDGFGKFAEFQYKDGEIGPIQAKFVGDGYVVSVLSERRNVFVASHLLSNNVDDLDLSVRSANCLKNSNVVTIRDLVEKTEDELRTMKNMGNKSREEIQEVLGNMGLRLGMRFPLRPALDDSIGDSSKVDLLESQVLVHDSKGNPLFDSGPLDERPVVAAYSARNAALAIGTERGRIIAWDVFTHKKLTDFEQGSLDCKGVRLTGAKGLDQLAPDSRRSLGEWLQTRGALLTANQLRNNRYKF